MNTSTPIPDIAVQTTDILRAEVAQLEKIRQQIASDMSAMRQQEATLKQLGGRARDPGSATAAAAESTALDAERDKLSRLRALTEGERRALIDERLAVREEKMLLERKAEELKQREAWLDAREKDFEAKFGARKAKVVTKPPFTAKIFSFGARKKTVV